MSKCDHTVTDVLISFGTALVVAAIILALGFGFAILAVKIA